MNREIKIADATEEELRTFGRGTLGLSLPPNCKIETLRSKIQQAWDKEHILLADPDQPEAPPAGAAPQPVTDEQQPPKRKMVRINIPITEEAGGTEPVPVGVNGSIMLIPRGEDVDVPEPYVEALEHAITHVYDPLPEGGINPVPRKVPLYPFQVKRQAA